MAQGWVSPELEPLGLLENCWRAGAGESLPGAGSARAELHAEMAQWEELEPLLTRFLRSQEALQRFHF